MQKKENNPRRDFLKKISIAAVSISAFSFLELRRSRKYHETAINTLSAEEANEIIKNQDFPVSKKIKPAPAPHKDLLG